MEQNRFKTIDVRHLGKIEVMPVVRMLTELRDEWDKDIHFDLNHNKKLSLNEVQHINFRWSHKQKDPVAYISLPLWDRYKAILLPIMQKAVQPIGYKNGYFPRVMLAKMNPGSMIPPHTDGETRGWIAHKIHIPLITNAETFFMVKNVKYHFEKGEIYEVNNSALHGAYNQGQTARIHLIFEYLDADINDVPEIDVNGEPSIIPINFPF
jgi:hypothetical protein